MAIHSDDPSYFLYQSDDPRYFLYQSDVQNEFCLYQKRNEDI